MKISSSNSGYPLVPLGLQLLVNWPLLNPQYWHVPLSIVPRQLPALSCRFTCLIILKQLSPPWLVLIFMWIILPKLLIITCNIHPCPRIFFPWQLLLVCLYTVKPRLNHESFPWKGAGWMVTLPIMDRVFYPKICSKLLYGGILFRGQRRWPTWI